MQEADAPAIQHGRRGALIVIQPTGVATTSLLLGEGNWPSPVLGDRYLGRGPSVTAARDSLELCVCQFAHLEI